MSDLDRALKAAAKPVPARVGQPAAQALLDRIVRSAPATAPSRHPRRPVRLVRPFRLVVGAAAAAVLATAVATVLPNPVEDAAPAYASWTASPGPLPDGTARAVAAACEEAPPASSVSAMVGEQRGAYAYLLVVAADRSATCFRDRDGTVRVTSFGFYRDSVAQLGPHGVVLYGWGQIRTGEGHIRIMSGRLGTAVTAVDVTVRSKDGAESPVVHATVRDGYLLAWYPEGSPAADTNTTLLTLRLRDGGTITGLEAGELFKE